MGWRVRFRVFPVNNKSAPLGSSLSLKESSEGFFFMPEREDNRSLVLSWTERETCNSDMDKVDLFPCDK